MFKDKIKLFLKEAIEKTVHDLSSSGIDIEPIVIETPRQKEHGDLASPIAMNLSKILKQSPLEIGEKIKNNLLADSDLISKVQVAPPGFLNLWLSPKIIREAVLEILSKLNLSVQIQ